MAMIRTDQITADCVLHDLPAHQYHAHFAINRGRLADLDQSIELYRARHVYGYADPVSESDDMALGSAVHLAMLEPETWRSRVVTSSLLRRGKKWEEFVREHAGNIILRPHQVPRAAKMAVTLAGRAGQLLTAPGPTEVSIFWTDKPTGRMCRLRADKLILGAGRNTCVDIKSTATDPTVPGKFDRQAADLRLWLQAAHYVEGIEAAYQKPCDFYFAAVQNRGAYGSRLFRYGPLAMARARDRWRDLIDELHRRHRDGDFGDEDEDQIFDLNYPMGGGRRERQEPDDSGL